MLPRASSTGGRSCRVAGVKKDTFDSMNDVIKESKRIMEVQPKIQKVYEEIDNYTRSYRSLEKENKNIHECIYTSVDRIHSHA